MADALLIEIYASQISGTDGSDVYVFVTSTTVISRCRTGSPPADLAALFDGTRSRYGYEVEGLHQVLLEQFGDEYLEEQDEVEFLISEEEPRTLAEIIEAEQEFFDKVWYVRSIAYEDDNRELPGDIRAGMMTARERVEGRVRAR